MDCVGDQIIPRLEEMTSLMNALDSRMNSLETRMNFQIGLTFAVWATVTGLLLAILVRG